MRNNKIKHFIGDIQDEMDGTFIVMFLIENVGVN